MPGFKTAFLRFFVLGILGCSSGQPDLKCEGRDCFCSNGEWIDIDSLCDGDNDCGNWQDERGCGTCFDQLPCEGYTGQCSDRSIDVSWLCDGELDCLDGEDERGCSSGSGGGGGGGSSSSYHPCSGLTGIALCICVTNDFGACSYVARARSPAATVPGRRGGYLCSPRTCGSAVSTGLRASTLGGLVLHASGPRGEKGL